MNILITLNEFAEIWRRDWLAGRRIGEATKLRYNDILNQRILPVLGGRRLRSLSAMDIDKLILALAYQGYAKQTIRNTYTVVHSVLHFAYRRGYLKEDICLKCDDLPEAHSRKMQSFTPSEARIFIKALDACSPTYRAFFLLALYGGFRRGELCALKWADIDFERHTVSIERSACLVGNKQILKAPKTAAGCRKVCLPEECFKALSILRKGHFSSELRSSMGQGTSELTLTKRSDSSPFLFTKSRSSEPLSLQQATNEFRRILLRHNKSCRPGEELPIIRLHDLRHTSATLLLAANTDIETVAHRLGHSRASITLDVYGHALPDNDVAAAGKLREMIGG